MDQKKITYTEQNTVQNTLKLREILKTLPPFARDYFRAIEAATTAKTRISYAYDIRIFFQFLLEENPTLKGKAMTEIPLEILDEIRACLLYTSLSIACHTGPGVLAVAVSRKFPCVQ